MSMLGFVRSGRDRCTDVIHGVDDVGRGGNGTGRIVLLCDWASVGVDTTTQGSSLREDQTHFPIDVII